MILRARLYGRTIVGISIQSKPVHLFGWKPIAGAPVFRGLKLRLALFVRAPTFYQEVMRCYQSSRKERI
jgi:hypothetical protein